MEPSSKTVNAKNVCYVNIWSARTPMVKKEKRAVVYFPATDTLYLSKGSEVFYRETRDSSVTYAFTLKTQDGFARTFRIKKDGSGNYFEGGGYVSVFVSSTLTLGVIEKLVSDILGSTEEARKRNELKQKEKLLLEQLQTIQGELSKMEK